MPIDAVCDSCLKPLQIDYRYDGVLIHRCSLCDKSGIVIVVRVSASSEVNDKVTPTA